MIRTTIASRPMVLTGPRRQRGISRLPKLAIDRVVMTLRASAALARAGQESEFFLEKHSFGDWGEMDERRRALNDLALQAGRPCVSTFSTLLGEPIALRTDIEHGVTAILMADECPSLAPSRRS